jgi:hypothetical protein
LTSTVHCTVLYCTPYSVQESHSASSSRALGELALDELAGMFGQLDSLGSHSCRPQTLSENQSSVRVRAANCVRVSQARSSASCEHTLLRMSKCKGPSLSCRSDGWLNRTVKIRAERKRTVGTHHVHVRARANEKQAPITASLYGMLIFSHDTTALYHARRNHVVRNLVERATVARTSRGGGGGGGIRHLLYLYVQ